MAGSGILTVSELNFRPGDGAIAAVDDGQLTVNGGTFTGNAATDGGAIDSNVGRYAPQITGATFVRNVATGDGGAIYDNSSASSMGVRGSVFTGNMAADGGGAIWDYGEEEGIAASTFWGNTAGAGGALWVDENYPEIIANVVVSRNSASGDGGGIYGTVSLDNSTVSGNHATADGGGIYDGPDTTVTLTGSPVTGNQPDNCEPPGSITGCTS